MTRSRRGPSVGGQSKGTRYFKWRSKNHCNNRSRNKYACAHSGPREAERRKRQIDRGQLREQNGLEA